MARAIYVVTASQVVTSQANPKGLFSLMPNYPKVFDSENYADEEAALNAAKAAYHDQVGKNYDNKTETRILATVTLETVYGKQMLCESVGKLPDEPEEQGEQNV